MDKSPDGNDEILNRARNYINELSPTDPRRAKRLSEVALALCARYQHSTAESTIDEAHRELYLHEAIRHGREAAEGTPPGDPARAGRFNNVSSMLSMRYELKGNEEDLEESINKGRVAVDETPRGDPDRASYLSNLSLSLCSRSKLPGTPGRNDDLDEAVDFAGQAAMDEGVDPLERVQYLNSLANVLGERFERLQLEENLNQAMGSVWSAIRIVEPDPRLPGLFTTLANLLGFRYKSLTGDVVDLEAAVRMRRKALALTPDDTNAADRAKIISNLAMSLDDLFKGKGELEDLNDAIRYGRMAVKLTPEGHFERVERLNNLGSALHAHFDRTESIKSLTESIQCGRQAVEVASCAGHPNRAMYLNNLGIRLCSLSSQGGHDQGFEEAIRCAHEAVNTEPSGPLKAMFLKNLSGMFNYRFEILGALADLKDAMRIANEIIVSTPPSDPTLPDSLELLASILFNKYERTKQVPFLEQAICKQHQANEKTGDSHPRKTYQLHNLSRLISIKYERRGDPKDLEDAMQYELKVLRLDDAEQRSRAPVLHSLSLLYGQQYDNTQNEEERETLLEIALSNAEAAVIATPEGNASRALMLESLGILLNYKFVRKKLPEVLQQAISKFAESLEQINSPPLIRIRAGIFAATLLYRENSDWVQAALPLEAAVRLLPRISPRALTWDDQQCALTTMSGLSAMAASTALLAGKPPPEALALLESGRGIMAGLFINLRSDVSDLDGVSPKLCQEYTVLRQRLSSSSQTFEAFQESPLPSTSASTLVSMGVEDLPPVDEVSKRLQIVQSLEKVEAKIREEVPGFQLPPSCSSLTKLAEAGAIVSFNVTPARRDAFIVTEDDIRVLSLPGLQLQTLKDNVKLFTGPDRITDGFMDTFHERNEELQKVLKWLWDVAVRPVLQDLGLLTDHAPGRLPRIWWVTSGLVGLTPLHAAGRKWGRGTENTASHVVSSYIPTFKALAYAREKSLKSPTWQNQRLLIVSMPKTTGWDDLDVTAGVVDIEESVSGSGIPIPTVLLTPSKADVLNEMQNSSLVHFACHGESDSNDPSSSSLLLKDGPDGSPERLAVRDLTRASVQQAQMAYLSACSTADNSSRDLMDEVIHVASAFQLVGFPHVIGTFWEADDAAANDVSHVFYRELVRNQKELKGYQRQDAFAYALHDAVTAVRAGRKRGSRVNRGASDNVTLWAPFIHLGC
ncbi:unnamed protein product [Calypogeia fissa]